MDTRCCSPPESWPGRCASLSSKPTSPSNASERERQVAVGRARRGEPRLDVPEGGEGRNEVELLEDEAERAQSQVGKVAIRKGSEIATLEEDVALARAVECTEQLKQRRLA